MIHIEGFLNLYNDWWTEDEIEIKGPEDRYYRSLAEVTSNRIREELGKNTYKSSEFNSNLDEGMIDVSMNIPKVAMRIYYSDDKCSLEEAQSNFILSSMGCLDVCQVATGYSEWTILGYDVKNFRLTSEDGGGHDLTEIFKSYIGKYIHILIDVVEV